MFGSLLCRLARTLIQSVIWISILLSAQAHAQSAGTAAATSIPYTMAAQDVSGNCTLGSHSVTGVLTPTGQANTYTTLYAGLTAITVTVPGSNTLVFSFPDAGGTTTEDMQLTFDSALRSITGSTNWTHTNGCMGYTTISGSWADSLGATTATTFPIANTSGREASVGAAFDGTNFLVGIQGDAISDQSVTAQLVSRTGILVGPRISTGARGGGAPRVAFDGTNYLLAWECDGAVATCITGQFVNTSGALVGAPFTLATGTKLELGFPGLIFDGTNYFVGWRNIRSTAGTVNTSDLLGQFVTSSGEKLGSVVLINTASYEQVRPGIAIAFDGANILAVWADGRNQRACYAGSSGSQYCYETDIYGQFIAKSSVSAAGTISGGNFLIDAGMFERDNTGGIVFDGTNYLVTFVEATANPCPSCRWEGYGILVAKNGAVIGSKFFIGNTTSNKRFPIPNYLGNKYLVTWTDGLEPLSASIKGQYVTTSGAVEGSEFALFSPTASGAVPLLGMVLTGGGVNLAVTSYDIPSADVMGSILTIPAGDTSPPTVPAGVNATASSSTQINLDWAASTDNVGVTGYKVYRNDVLVGGPAVAGYSDAGLSASTGYSYTVAACDAAGNCSANSGAAIAQTSAPITVVDRNALLPPPPTVQAVFTVPTGRMPTDAASVTRSGTFGNATLVVRFDASKVFAGGSFAGAGRFAAGYNIYVAALVPSGTLGLPNATWFVYAATHASTHPLTHAWAELSFPMAAYMEGLAQDATNTVEINLLQDVDVTGLLGSEIYVGYGTSDTEMLSRGRYRGVYKVQ